MDERPERSAPGQNAKYSVRADIFRFALELGHCAKQRALPTWAMSRHGANARLSSTYGQHTDIRKTERPQFPEIPSRCSKRNYLRDVLSASGMDLSSLLELSGMELHEVAHVRRYFAGELEHGVRHAVVTPKPVQLGHGREC